MPVQSLGLTTVTALSGGERHSLALRSDGTVWAWGCNYFGQLGDGSTNHSATPKPVPGLGGIVTLSAGNHHSLAVGEDGSLWGWGWSSVGPPAGDGVGPVLTAPVREPSR